MYSFLTGPMLWTAFLVFIIGMVIKISYLYGVSKSKDMVFYNHADMAWGLKSILHWLYPLGSHSMRKQPVFSIAVFLFHTPLVLVPLFLNAHNILWDESFGISLPSLPDRLSDTLTVIFLFAALFLLIRRMVKPEVKIITEFQDYFLLILCIMPFLTGFLMFHQKGAYEVLMYFHIISGELLLILIPFTKLGHMVLFFFTRLFIGFEMGGRRGTRTW